ncbi:MAG: aminotransferase class IV [Leucobacter sp.]
MSAASTRRLLVADSFRVRANPRTGAAEVRGLDRHLERFRGAALGQLPGAEERERENRRLHDEAVAALRASGEFSPATFLFAGRCAADTALLDRIDAFLDDALARISEYGEGFPRIELWEPERAGGDPELSLALRPLPELSDTIKLRTAPGIRLEHAGRKGPNIGRLAELNRELGAEALLLDPKARALEGATTSLVWWTDASDGSGRYVSETWSRPDRVDSVTEGLLREAAQQRLVGRKPNRRRTGSFSEGRLTPAELAGHEVWAVNALHGIRPVTSIDGVPADEPVETRLRWFREALDRTWQPVLGAGADYT